MMRELDEILYGSNREKRPSPSEDSRQSTNGDGANSYAEGQPKSRSSFESNHRERTRAAPSRPGWTNPVPSEADATSETRLTTVPQVRSVPSRRTQRCTPQCLSP